MSGHDRTQPSKAPIALVAVLMLAATPFVLVGLALAEETWLETARLSSIYRRLGVLEPLRALYGWLLGYR